MEDFKFRTYQNITIKKQFIHIIKYNKQFTAVQYTYTHIKNKTVKNFQYMITFDLVILGL